jgi:hypothetical protein
MLVLYEVDVFVRQGPIGIGLSPAYTATLLTADGPGDVQRTMPSDRSPFAGKGYPSGPPFTLPVPSGSQVLFCVGASRIYGKPNIATGRLTSCIATQVP